MNNILKHLKNKDVWFYAAVVIALVVFISLYSSNKGKFGESMSSQRGNKKTNVPQQIPSNSELMSEQPSNQVQPSSGNDSEYAQVDGSTSAPNEPSGCSQKQQMMDPSTLLPKDQSNEWSQLNPSSQGSLDGINLLKAGYHIGAVGQTNRNPNLYLNEPEPPNPQLSVSPWGNSTIAPNS